MFARIAKACHRMICEQPLLALALIAVALVAQILPLMTRPLWYDEIVTFHVSRLDNMAVIWEKVKAGADLNPPLFYLATHGAYALMGSNEFSTRLPQLAGFLAMLLCVHRFVGKGGNPSAAIAAAGFPFLTCAPSFGAEGRPYGMVLGFSAIAAAAWQSASREESRRFTLPLLSVGLLCALQSHCYAVIVPFAFGAAELARSYMRRRIDWPMWLAISAPLLSISTYFSLLSGVPNAFADRNPIFRVAPDSFYVWLLSPASGSVLLVLTAIALIAITGSESESIGPILRIPIPEIVLAVGLAAAPFLVWIIQRTLTHISYPRYSLVAVIGLSLLFGMLLTAASRAKPHLASLCVALIAAALIPKPFLPETSTAPLEDVTSLINATTEPIVIANPLAFVEINEYGAESLRRRTIYVADGTQAVTFLGTNMVDDFFAEKLSSVVPLSGRIASLVPFLNEHRRFLMLSDFYSDLEWFPKYLTKERKNVRLIGKFHLSGRPVTLCEVTE